MTIDKLKQLEAEIRRFTATDNEAPRLLREYAGVVTLEEAEGYPDTIKEQHEAFKRRKENEIDALNDRLADAEHGIDLYRTRWEISELKHSLREKEEHLESLKTPF